MTRRLGRVALMICLLAGGACYRVTSQLLETPEPPDDLYRCLQLELGRAGYAIVGADRASGWLHAQRRVERWDKVVQAEIYATVIPGETQGSHLQFTENSHAESDAADIRKICAPGGGEGVSSTLGAVVFRRLDQVNHENLPEDFRVTVR